MVKVPLGAESWRVDREHGLSHRLPRTRVHQLHRTLFRRQPATFRRQPATLCNHPGSRPSRSFFAVSGVRLDLPPRTSSVSLTSPRCCQIAQHSSDHLVGRGRSGFVTFHQYAVLIPEFAADMPNSGFDQSYFRKLCLSR